MASISYRTKFKVHKHESKKKKHHHSRDNARFYEAESTREKKHRTVLLLIDMWNQIRFCELVFNYERGEFDVITCLNDLSNMK